MIVCIQFNFSVDFVIPAKGEPVLEAYDKWKEWAQSKVCCDYGFHVAITWWSDKVAEDMETLTKERGKLKDVFFMMPFIISVSSSSSILIAYHAI